MGIIEKKLNEKIQALRNSFETNKELIHNGVKGSLNEYELNDLIKDIIPSKFKITKGIIENKIGKQSNETDIILYDDEILPPYIKNELSIIPIESVKYVIEVKSYLSSTELKTTIDKFSNFLNMKGRSPTVLFAFSSDIKGSELDRYKKNDVNFYNAPSISVICTVDKSYYYKTRNEYYLKGRFQEPSATGFPVNIERYISPAV